MEMMDRGAIAARIPIGGRIPAYEHTMLRETSKQRKLMYGGIPVVVTDHPGTFSIVRIPAGMLEPKPTLDRGLMALIAETWRPWRLTAEEREIQAGMLRQWVPKEEPVVIHKTIAVERSDVPRPW